MASTVTSELTLNCLLFGKSPDKDIFCVKIKPTESIDDLKEKIEKEKQFKNIIIWRVEINIDDKKFPVGDEANFIKDSKYQLLRDAHKSYQARVDMDIEEELKAIILYPRHSVALYWPDQPLLSSIHIIGIPLIPIGKERITNPYLFYLLDQDFVNESLEDIILNCARRSRSHLPIVETSIGDVKACRALDSGTKAVVFEAHTTNDVQVALKYCLDNKPLIREVEALKKLEGLEDVPKLLHAELGYKKEMFPYIVTSMVGQKITKVDIPIICNIIADIIGVLKNLHEYGYIHSDIHPGNIVDIGGKFRLSDFGLSVRRSDKRDPIPTNQLEEDHMIFASHNRGKYLGPGDDLEALCYTVAFMYDRDKKYWHAATEDPCGAIHLKEEKLFYLFDGLPQVFQDFFDCVYDLDVTATPDYEYWQKQFRETARYSSSPLKRHHSETPPPGSFNHGIWSERRKRSRIEHHKPFEMSIPI